MKQSSFAGPSDFSVSNCLRLSVGSARVAVQLHAYVFKQALYSSPSVAFKLKRKLKRLVIGWRHAIQLQLEVAPLIT
jgi:hypothetical protein